MSRTKLVDKRIRELWARLASIAAKKAIASAERGETFSAEDYVKITAKWLDKAGARATDFYFGIPQ